MTVLTGWLTISGFDLALAWFSSVSSECLCVFYLHGALYVTIFLVTSFSSPFSELSLVGVTLTIVVQCYDTVGWVIQSVQLSPK